MKSQSLSQTSGRGQSTRKPATSALPYMSERQIQAYLAARDTIRRVQRTASILDSISGDAQFGGHASQRRRKSH